MAPTWADPGLSKYDLVVLDHILVLLETRRERLKSAISKAQKAQSFLNMPRMYS